MHTKTFKHENVLPDGTFKDQPGAVVTNGKTNMSAPNGGCGLPGCNCSPGHYIAVIKPRTENGIVEDITIHFRDKEEMNTFIETKELLEKHNLNF